MTKNPSTRTQYLGIEGKSFETVGKIVGILTNELSALDITVISFEDGDLEEEQFIIPHRWDHAVETFLEFKIPIRTDDPVERIKKLLEEK